MVAEDCHWENFSTLTLFLMSTYFFYFCFCIFIFINENFQQEIFRVTFLKQFFSKTIKKLINCCFTFFHVSENCQNLIKLPKTLFPFALREPRVYVFGATKTMADKWKNLKKMMERKRDINKKGKPKHPVKADALTVQRLSTNVSGKAQKYSRIGPHDFVPYRRDDLPLEGLTSACREHFSSTIEADQMIDIVASEQGPSCSSLQQVPDLKLIHFRFVTKPVSAASDDEECDVLSIQRKKRKLAFPITYVKVGEQSSTSIQPNICSQMDNARSNNEPKLASTASGRVSVYPKSLSMADMLRLGKVVECPKNLKTLDIIKFKIDGMIWSILPDRVEFSIDSEAFGEGGFRQAFKATRSISTFEGKWVIKRYLPNTIDVIQQLGQSTETHTRKAVQMHALAKNFTDSFCMWVKSVCRDEFGKVPAYCEIFLAKEDEHWVSVEPYIEGSFAKYINNTGIVTDSLKLTEVCKKVECLVHYSYEKSNKQLMLSDIQGSGYTLYDPEIASSTPAEDGEYLFCAGNLSNIAISTFVANHTCNYYCKIVGLQTLEK